MTSIAATILVGGQIETITFDDPARHGELTIDPIPTEGVTTYDFVATDAAGHVTTASATVSIDNVAPVVTVAKTPTTDYANGDVTIGVDVTDTGGSPIVVALVHDRQRPQHDSSARSAGERRGHDRGDRLRDGRGWERRPVDAGDSGQDRQDATDADS